MKVLFSGGRRCDQERGEQTDGFLDLGLDLDGDCGNNLLLRAKDISQSSKYWLAVFMRVMIRFNSAAWSINF
jgi:hypothetical protein